MPTLPKLARHDWTAEQLATKADASDLGAAAALDVGTTAGTVKAGDWQPSAADVTDSTAAGRALLKAADAAAQRAAMAAAKSMPGEVRSRVATDGSDQTAVLQGEIDALMAAGGGTIVLPIGTVTLNGTLTLTNDGATPPKQPALTLRGQGAHWSGRGTAPVGGTTLDIKGADTYGKLKTNGLGLLAIEGVTFRDSSAGTTPFLYTTNTTIHIRGCAFVGSKSGTSCDQDAIILGGTAQVEGFAGWNDGFQGYGTVIEHNFFSGIRAGIKGRSFANAVVVRDNTWWTTCGNPAGAAIEWDGDVAGVGQHAAGGLISGNLIEVPSYKYAIRLKRCVGFTVDANNVFDKTATTTAAYYTDATCVNNTIREGFTASGLTPLVDLSGTTWLYPTSGGIYSVMPPARYADINYPTEMYKVLFNGGPSSFKIQPGAAAGSESETRFQILRSAAESTNPSTPIAAIYQSGKLVLAGSAGGSIDFRDAAATTLAQITSSGRTWKAAGTGGAMSIDSGTGGSNLDLKNYAVRCYDHNSGPLRATIGAGIDGVKFGAAADVTIQRNAAADLAVNTDVEVTGAGGAIILASPDGTRYRITVANGGTLAVGAA